MSVYLKLQQTREDLSKLSLKKTGENTYSKYKYYDLGDILPSITELSNKHKICSVINYGDNAATLTIYNSEKPEEKVEFSSTVASAEMKGTQAIQRLGAEQTYLRRYLYMTAFEIVENDVIDETNNKNEPKRKELTDAQINRAYAIASSKGIDKTAVNAWTMTKFKKEISQLTKAEYDELCNAMEVQKNAEKKQKDG